MKILAGDLVVPRLKRGVEKILLWSENEIGHPTMVTDEIAEDEIMMVLKTEKFSSEVNNINDEWKNGACLILSPQGKIGWTGLGWLKKLPSAS
jgi:hypothetical protein